MLEEDERSRSAAEPYRQLNGTVDVPQSTLAFESVLVLWSDDVASDGDDKNWTEENIFRSRLSGKLG